MSLQPPETLAYQSLPDAAAALPAARAMTGWAIANLIGVLIAGGITAAGAVVLLLAAGPHAAWEEWAILLIPLAFAACYALWGWQCLVCRRGILAGDWRYVDRARMLTILAVTAGSLQTLFFLVVTLQAFAFAGPAGLIPLAITGGLTVFDAFAIRTLVLLHRVRQARRSG